MSFLITCPHCGPRSVYEYRFGGEVKVRQTPGAPDADWFHYTYTKTNSAGLQKEWWYHRSGCKPRIVASHQHQLRTLLAKKPDLTLKELRAATGLACTLPAIHYVLARLGLTYKKRRSGLVNKTGPTSNGRGGPGGGSRPDSTRRGWSSSMNRVRKPT